IFVAGFGAFFWFLVIHPVLHAEVNLLKEGLSQAYVALDCIVLLLLGVLLLTGAEDARRPRIHALLLSGFAILFLGDLTWSLASSWLTLPHRRPVQGRKDPALSPVFFPRPRCSPRSSWWST